MELGSFSISLTVKDINASKKFYETLGFKEFGGNSNEKWLIMKQGTSVIGLFEGMFDKNIMTFNPGWDQDAQTLDSFTDVRAIQKELKEKGIALDSQTDEEGSGPGSIMLKDPDDNTILIDQHV